MSSSILLSQQTFNEILYLSISLSISNRYFRIDRWFRAE